MRDIWWGLLALSMAIITFAAIPTHRTVPCTNPRFVLQDFTERECLYDNQSGKYITCWLKGEGP